MLETKHTINDTGMPQWGVRHRLTFVQRNESKNDQHSSYFVKQENSEDEVEAENPLKVEPLTVPEFKRKRDSRCRSHVMKAAVAVKMEAKIGSKNRKKREAPIDRWSAERYMLAEKSMLEILKAEGATFSKPISRLELRKAARTRIGDTGLLDHLLKHIDGKVAPGSTERFKRCFNTHGIMEYWLESAELDGIRKEAGVTDPYWTPPIRFPPGGGACGCTGLLGELESLKAEMEKMKSDMQGLMSKKQEDETKSMRGIHEELLKWKSSTEQQMAEIVTSLKGLHGIYDELLRWKTKVDQQLVEITNSLNGLLAHKDRTALGPPIEEWEDWFDSSNLDNFQGDGFGPLISVEQNAMVLDPISALPSQFNNGDNLSQAPICVKELEQLKEEVANMKRNILELVPKKQEEDQANVTPDSSITVSSKSDFDNSVILLQEMMMELFKWKDKTEQRLVEVSNTLYELIGLK